MKGDPVQPQVRIQPIPSAQGSLSHFFLLFSYLFFLTPFFSLLFLQWGEARACPGHCPKDVPCGKLAWTLPDPYLLLPGLESNPHLSVGRKHCSPALSLQLPGCRSSAAPSVPSRLSMQDTDRKILIIKTMRSPVLSSLLLSFS